MSSYPKIWNSIEKAKDQLERGIPFTTAQSKWFVGAMEAAQNLIDADERLIHTLTVENLKKGIEISELKGIPLTEDSL